MYVIFPCSRARERSGQSREDLRAIPHPRLIFVGALSQYKVDFSMIRQVAEKLPHVHWILIGAVGEGQPGTQRPPEGYNIHLLGPRPYEALPSYLGYCDIAVLPATRNNYTAAMFPMKFFEYLASGLPVVSTRLPALEDFEDLYFPADSAEEFALHIEQVLAGKRKDAEAIEAACRYHTWEARFARMEKRIREVVAIQTVIGADGFTEYPCGEKGKKVQRALGALWTFFQDLRNRRLSQDFSRGRRQMKRRNH